MAIKSTLTLAHVDTQISSPAHQQTNLLRVRQLAKLARKRHSFVQFATQKSTQIFEAGRAGCHLPAGDFRHQSFGGKALHVSNQVACSALPPRSDLASRPTSPARARSSRRTFEASILGRSSLFVLTDDCSWKYIQVMVILLALKSETKKRLKLWVARVERECGQSLGRLRMDDGGEFTNHSSKEWLAARGVTQWFAPPRSPQSNGVAERMSGTLQDKAPLMMAQVGL